MLYTVTKQSKEVHYLKIKWCGVLKAFLNRLIFVLD